MLKIILLNPTFSIETGKLLSHDGATFVDEKDIPIRFDRSVQKSSKSNAATANSLAGQSGAKANQIGSTIIPGLEQEATNPTGYTPLEKGRMLTAAGEGIGGANAGVTGEANLAAARTRNAGGFTHALDEAERIRGRQMAGANLGVENEDARLAQEKQRFAQQQLSGLYGTDTSNQLKAMGLSDEDLKTALEAGKSGWLQNLEGGIGTAVAPYCVAEGTLIRTMENLLVPVEQLRTNDRVMSYGRPAKLLADPEFSEQECVRLTSNRGHKLECSLTHTLVLREGGYVFASTARDAEVAVFHGCTVITDVQEIGKLRVVHLKLDGSHSFLSGDFWSLE